MSKTKSDCCRWRVGCCRWSCLHLCGASAEVANHPAHEGPSVSIPADQIKFFGAGVKTEKGELNAGPAYGDLQNGKHGTFILMPHGFVSPAHTHTEDYFGVVIKGVGANQAPGGKIVPLVARLRTGSRRAKRPT